MATIVAADRVAPGDAPQRRTLPDIARAYLTEPDDAGARQRFISALVSASDPVADARLDRAIAALAADDRVDHQRLVGVAARRLTALPAAPEVLDQIGGRGSPSAASLVTLARGLDEPLSIRLLSDHVYASAEVEVALTALRAAWLDALSTNAPFPWPSPNLLAAVAFQMQTTEWVYEESGREADQLAALAGRLHGASLGRPPHLAVLVYAMYRSLGDDHAHLAAAPELEDSSTAEVVRRHIAEPGEEQMLARSLPRLGSIADSVSRSVRAQYEERPYPRWRHIPDPDPRPLGERVAAALGNPELAATIDIAEPDILIAGCGTGRHALLTAARYQGARVLAVDLSLASLAYGERQARRLGIANVEFAHADILELQDLGRVFDVVEAVGVLHHMADPEAGWRRLRALTRPGGLMKLGLYSRYGRSLLDPVTRLISERALEPTLDGIRAVRTLVRSLPSNSPARSLAGTPDFFSRSGCRDLFFPAHEDRFVIPRIQRAVAAMGLAFLGFELLSPRIRALYLEAFPDEPTGRDLTNWDELERAFPALFAAMYRFWVRAPS